MPTAESRESKTMLRRDANSWFRGLKRAPLVLLVPFVSIVIASFVGHRVIYKQFIVPRLSTVPAIPVTWWLGNFAPRIGAPLGS